MLFGRGGVCTIATKMRILRAQPNPSPTPAPSPYSSGRFSPGPSPSPPPSAAAPAPAEPPSLVWSFDWQEWDGPERCGGQRVGPWRVACESDQWRSGGWGSEVQKKLVYLNSASNSGPRFINHVFVPRTISLVWGGRSVGRSVGGGCPGPQMLPPPPLPPAPGPVVRSPHHLWW